MVSKMKTWNNPSLLRWFKFRQYLRVWNYPLPPLRRWVTTRIQPPNQKNKAFFLWSAYDLTMINKKRWLLPVWTSWYVLACFYYGKSQKTFITKQVVQLAVQIMSLYLQSRTVCACVLQLTATAKLVSLRLVWLGCLHIIK